MPIVDYNRIYHVQSRERKPVLNPVNVPDAAGAFLRGAVPAAGAALPGLRAKLADADARYREKAGRDRNRWQAVANLIGVGKDVALAYEGAVERRDEADLNALQAAWQNHMNQGAEEAWRRPYKRGGEGDAKIDGPLVAIRELDAAFDESDAMAGARENVKQRFAEWRQRASQPYYSKAQRQQADAADNFQQNALIAKWQAADAAVHSLYGKKLEDEGEWEAAVQEAIEGKIADEKFQMSRRGGVEMLPEQEAIRRRALRQGYEVDRAKSLFAVCAASDDLNVGTDELNEGLRIANEADLDADVRTALVAQSKAATDSRERNHAAAQGQIAREADSIIDSIRFGDVTGADFQTAQDKVRELVQALDPAPDGSGVKLSGGAAKLLDDLDKAVADRELINFATEWNDAAWDFQKDDLTKRLRAMPEGRAKDAITKMLYGGATTGSTQQTSFGKSQASALLTHNQLNRHSARDVLEKAAAQLEADGDIVKFREVFDMVRSYMRFSDSCKDGTADHTDEYLSSIRGALEDAFGVKIGDFIKTDKDGNPVFDKDGNPVPAETDPDRKYRSTVGYREHFDYGRANRSNEGATRIVDSAGMKLANQTLQDSYSLATEFLTQRLNGFDGKGKKGGTAITPESARSELVELFREVLARQGTSLDEHLLQTTILSMRDNYARLGVPQATLDIADVTKIERAWNSGPAVAGGENAQGDDNR